jgi:hypothetical protein
MRWRPVALGFGAVVVAVAATAVLHARPTDTDLALAKYAAASCLDPHRTPTGQAWDNNLVLRNGTLVNVSANAFVGGLVLVRYPDGTTRDVTTLRDYVYPHDIRLTPGSQTLWIVNSGLAAGIWREAHLYQYDLTSRVLVRDIDLDPDGLPARCPVAARNDSDPAHTSG